MKYNLIVIAGLAMFAASGAMAQSTPNPPKDPANSSIVTRMMAFDTKHDGKLTRDEITDERLLRLFDEADTNKDGVVTKEELVALATKLEAEVPAGSGRGGPDGPDGPGGGFGGPGGPGGFGGPGGPGGRRGPGGPPQPGQILPPMLQDALNLTDDQKKQVAELQKEVDTKLATILTVDQLKQVKQMRGRGRGPGGPGGPGGRGGPGGPPPDQN